MTRKFLSGYQVSPSVALYSTPPRSPPPSRDLPSARPAPAHAVRLGQLDAAEHRVGRPVARLELVGAGLPCEHVGGLDVAALEGGVPPRAAAEVVPLHLGQDVLRLRAEEPVLEGGFEPQSREAARAPERVEADDGHVVHRRLRRGPDREARGPVERTVAAGDTEMDNPAARRVEDGAVGDPPGRGHAAVADVDVAAEHAGGRSPALPVRPTAKPTLRAGTSASASERSINEASLLLWSCLRLNGSLKLPTVTTNGPSPEYPSARS